MNGRCLCGAVTYEITGDILMCGHCHCSRCRRATGTAHSTWIQMLTEQLHITSGRDNIETYRTEGFANRSFCKTCGSKLFSNQWPDGAVTGLPVGTLDGDPGIEPNLHVGVGSKAPWHEITDDLPQVDEP